MHLNQVNLLEINYSHCLCRFDLHKEFTLSLLLPPSSSGPLSFPGKGGEKCKIRQNFAKNSAWFKVLWEKIKLDSEKGERANDHGFAFFLMIFFPFYSARFFFHLKSARLVISVSHAEIWSTPGWIVCWEFFTENIISQKRTASCAIQENLNLARGIFSL